MPVRDMAGFCEKIIDRTRGLSASEFTTDPVLYEAVLWNLALLGEAVTNVPDEIEEAHTEVAWSAIVDMRNRLIHQYWKIASDTVWDIVASDIPDLLPMLRAIVADSE